MRPGRRKKIKKTEKTYKFLTRMKGKMLFVFFIIIAVLIALDGTFGIYTIKKRGQVCKIILNQQEYSSKTIPFRRGDIVDRKGTVLATSTDVYNVILDCSVLTSREQYLEPTIAAMVQCFGVDETELRAYVSENPKKRYYKVMDKLPYEEIAQFEDLQNDEKNGKISRVCGLRKNISGSIRMIRWQVRCLGLRHPVMLELAGWRIIIMRHSMEWTEKNMVM